MDFLKINRINLTSESLDLFYSNAPFIWIVIGVVLLTLAIISNSMVQQYLTYEEEKKQRKKKHERQMLEYSVPIVCGIIVIAMTYHSNHLSVEPGSSKFVWKDKRFFTYFTPNTLKFDLSDIVGVRVTTVDQESSDPTTTQNTPRSNYFVRLDLKSGKVVEIWTESSRDQFRTQELGTLLADFISKHPEFPNEHIYTRL